MEEKNEEVVEETTQNQQDSGDENTVKVDESKFDSAGDDSVIKIDLSKPPVTSIVEETPLAEEVAEEVVEESVQEQPVLEEVTQEEEEQVEEAIEEAVAESNATGKPLPENIQKLVDFMDETGGDLNDYVKLNANIEEMDNSEVLHEYYKETKPHLNDEEINFLLEDNFSFDEDLDDTKDIKKKKIALKEQVANAKSHLEERKSKYYEEIKHGSKLTTEQAKAIDFFNRYEKESEQAHDVQKKQVDTFLNKTENVFNDKFKGFEYNVGDKKYRFNVNNSSEVKDTQSDINNFVGKFLNKDGTMDNARGYHKSLFTAMNPDVIANHFYEQGKADAIKDGVARAKNINTDARGSHNEVNVGGMKYRILGDDSNSLKVKMRSKK